MVVEEKITVKSMKGYYHPKRDTTYNSFEANCPFCGQTNILAFWSWRYADFPRGARINTPSNICEEVNLVCPHLREVTHADGHDKDEIYFSFEGTRDNGGEEPNRFVKGLGI